MRIGKSYQLETSKFQPFGILKMNCFQQIIHAFHFWTFVHICEKALTLIVLIRRVYLDNSKQFNSWFQIFQSILGIFIGF